MQRIVAISLALFFLGLAGLMASVGFFVRDPIPVVTARSPLVVAPGETPDAGPRATLAVDPAFRFELTGEGLGAIRAAQLRRGEAGAGDIDIEVADLGGGLFQGRGQITAPGRWTLVLVHEGGSLEAPFILQE